MSQYLIDKSLWQNLMQIIIPSTCCAEFIIFKFKAWVQDRRLWPACWQIEIGWMAMPAN